ncbi:MAG: plastocyanin/azurin family copper-binding protein [Gemmatimonadaceae bacterium]
MKTLSRILATVAITAAAACGGGSGYSSGGGGGTTTGPNQTACPSTPGTVCLVSGNQFSPTTITVSHGSNVTFDNISATTHNVTFTTAGAPANVPNFASGSQPVAFPTAGTYNYHCTIHGLSMSGVVIVQ